MIVYLGCVILPWIYGLKLEHWQNPSIEGSIEPSALQSAKRNPKVFFGVSTQSKVYSK